MNKQLFYVGLLSRVLWLRAAAYAAGAVAAVLAAHELGRLLPPAWVLNVGRDAVEQILSIMASSMLAVATFSLTTLVAAAGSVISNTSPRAAGLLLDDPRAQNALSSFIGTFIFSVVGLIGLSADFRQEPARFLLFIETLLVLTVVIVRLLRWVDQLSKVGRVEEVIKRVEGETRRAFAEREPYLGGRQGGLPPADALAVFGDEVGYVQHIDVAHLDAVARKHGLTVHLAVLPGAFVRLTRPIFHLEGAAGELDATTRRALLGSVVVAGTRTFRQDPRLGLVVLSEIASRALSPAVNDPGTAINVVGAAVRLLSVWAERHWEERPTCKHPHVVVPALSAADVFDDVFRPIARDGAKMVEVGAALQKAFRDLARARAEGFAHAARHHARTALARAEQAAPFEEDLELLRELAAQVETGDRQGESPRSRG